MHTGCAALALGFRRPRPPGARQRRCPCPRGGLHDLSSLCQDGFRLSRAAQHCSGSWSRRSGAADARGAGPGLRWDARPPSGSPVGLSCRDPPCWGPGPSPPAVFRLSGRELLAPSFLRALPCLPPSLAHPRLSACIFLRFTIIFQFPANFHLTV